MGGNYAKVKGRAKKGETTTKRIKTKNEGDGVRKVEYIYLFMRVCIYLCLAPAPNAF